MRLFLPILEALNLAGVSYVVVGGLAVVLHGHARLTRDVDLVINLERGNVKSAIDCLGALGFVPRAPVRLQDFVDPVIRERWIEEKGLVAFSLVDPKNPMISIDLFSSNPLPFEGLHERAKLMEIEGVEIPVCSLADLIALKSGTGRSQDEEDIQALRRLNA